jgi:UDP-N-acetylglucosamine 2-epimerase (non-hydrolysing)
MRICLVGAARPNFMKVAPVLRALESRGCDLTLVHTDQHYDDAMSGRFFRELDIRDPDIRLNAGSGTHAEVTAAVMTSFEPVVEQYAFDAVVVVGDVNSTLACTLVASKAGVPVAHVEAGLRSRDRAMPEEINRICTDHLSDWLFTTSPDADENLASEGVDPGRTFLVGNVMIDTLLHNLDRIDRADSMQRFDVAAREYLLVTLHRPSNVDSPDVLARLGECLEQISRDRVVLFPVHPRTRSRLQDLGFTGSSTLRLLEPAGYHDFLALMAEAGAVLTDSGGVQEETTVLGVPCITARENTERPITVIEGTNQVVGTDPERILTAIGSVFGQRFDRRPALWDGKAAERIADVLLTVPPPLAHYR